MAQSPPQPFFGITLCYYVIGLFNRAQTNHKHKTKRMWFGCEQPFLSGERCVTSQKTAVCIFLASYSV